MKLVTGANGFIGSNLDADIKITRNDADLTKYEEVIDILHKYNPTTVIHTAAKHGNFLDMLSNHTNFLQDNIRMDLNVIKACHELNIQNLIMISSISSFPYNSKLPYIEEEFFNGDVSSDLYGYAFSKKVCVSLCQAYQKEYNLNYKSIILGNVYGKKNNISTNDTVISKLVFDCLYAIKNNLPWIIYGNGKPVRDFLYVTDLNYILDRIIKSKYTDPLIVSSGNLVNIKTVVELIIKYLNYKGDVIWGNEKYLGQLEKYSDISKLKSIIGDFKFTDIETGIKDICGWYLNFQDKIFEIK